MCEVGISQTAKLSKGGGEKRMEKTKFDYSKLKGRIKEICGTQKDFAERLGISEGSLTSKLLGHTYFTQEEIRRSMGILAIIPTKVHEYFFTI